jgi:hypothetical protein
VLAKDQDIPVLNRSKVPYTSRKDTKSSRGIFSYKKKNRSVKSHGVLKGSFEPQIAKIISHFRSTYKYEDTYESETFEISIPKKYTPDFVLKYPDGRVKVIECKGYFPDEDRKKCLAFVNQYPEYDYLIVFQRDNPIYTGSNFRYTDWCTKNGIKSTVGIIPEDWLND